MHGSAVGEAESLAYAAGGLVSVRPFIPTRVAAVVQEPLAAQGLERFERALCEKVRWFGSELLTPRVAEPDAGAIAEAIAEQLALDARLVVVAGSKAMDALDPAFRALDALGARRERHGVPAHPGSLFWLARLRDAAIVGMPTCGLFSQATVFDLVLPRVLAGERVDARSLAALGHGGLLTRDVAYRFAPYRASRQRGALDAAEEEVEVDRRPAPYGATVMEHFRRPRSQGRLAAPDVVREGSNPLCGDRIRIELAIHGGCVADARFTANACAISVAASSLLMERVRGMAAAAAEAISDDEMLAALVDEIPAARRACAILPLATLRAALATLDSGGAESSRPSIPA
jgi:NifU-like protein involved in Fe-S cluster formation